ncbi:MAG: hypothetical protein ACLVKO_07160 [Dysgonomonas sp.]
MERTYLYKRKEFRTLGLSFNMLILMLLIWNIASGFAIWTGVALVVGVLLCLYLIYAGNRELQIVLTDNSFSFFGKTTDLDNVKIIEIGQDKVTVAFKKKLFAGGSRIVFKKSNFVNDADWQSFCADMSAIKENIIKR